MFGKRNSRPIIVTNGYLLAKYYWSHVKKCVCKHNVPCSGDSLRGENTDWSEAMGLKNVSVFKLACSLSVSLSLSASEVRVREYWMELHVTIVTSARIVPELTCLTRNSKQFVCGTRQLH